MTADQFLCQLLTENAADTRESFAKAAIAKTNPAMSVSELADAIANAGAPQFAAQILDE